MILYKITKVVLNPFFRFYYNPTIIGKENIPKSGGIIIAGNHRHALDQHHIIISSKRPIHYMAKKEYFDEEASLFSKDNKFTRWLSKKIVNSYGCIRVDRTIKDEEASQQALEVLKNGKALGLFPEGTRNTTEKFLLPFKFGCVSLAKKSDAYIVPFGITGTHKFRSKDLIIRIGKPFKVTDMSLEKANEKLRETIEKLMLENLK